MHWGNTLTSANERRNRTTRSKNSFNKFKLNWRILWGMTTIGSYIGAVPNIKSELNKNTEDQCILHCITQQIPCFKVIKFSNGMTIVACCINFIKGFIITNTFKNISVTWRLTTKIILSGWVEERCWSEFSTCELKSLFLWHWKAIPYLL